MFYCYFTILNAFCAIFRYQMFLKEARNISDSLTLEGRVQLRGMHPWNWCSFVPQWHLYITIVGVVRHEQNDAKLIQWCYLGNV